MLKGKRLYDAAREHVEGTLMPIIVDSINEGEEHPGEEEEALAVTAELGIALLIDMAESLHKIATKIG